MSGLRSQTDVNLVDSRVSIALARLIVDYSLASLAADLAAKVPNTRTISGGGLVSGGGDLSANRTLTVNAASDAEAIAGLLTNKAVTPAALAAALASVLAGYSAIGHNHAIADVTALQTALDDKDLVQISEWTYSSAVATVDFGALSAYSYLEAHIDGVSATAGENLCCRVSVGGTYQTTGYAGIANNALATSVSNATDRMLMQRGGAGGGTTHGVVRLYAFKQAKKTRGEAILHQLSTNDVSYASARYDSDSACDGLRFLWSAGANFDAGRITLYGRK